MVKWGMMAVLAVPLLTWKAPALTINLTYDASVTNLPNAAQVKTAVATAAQTFQSLYTNAITVNIAVYWGATGPFLGGIDLGASETQFIGKYTYSQLTNGLRSARKSPADSNSVAGLPASDPIAGNSWWCPRAEAKALGIITIFGISVNDTNNDGSVGFNSSTSYTFDPNNRAVAGKYDFIGVAEHEISEVLGRIYDLNFGGGGYVPYDLFRFTNSGTRSFNVNDTNVYFSTDNGVTALKYFYTNVNMGDIQDWQSSTPTDSFDSFISSGNQGVLTSADFTALDILGYNGIFVTPPLLTGVRLTNGNFQINFTNTPNASFSILANTNFKTLTTNWPVLGTATQVSSGHYQFTDTHASTNKVRFYRVRSP